MAKTLYKSRRRLRPYEVTSLWLSRFIIWLVLIMVFFPILSVVVSSLQPGDAFYSERLIPDHITLANYKALFKTSPYIKGYSTWLRNTLVIGLIVGAAQVLMTASAAYAFSRLKFHGRRYGIMVLWLIQTFPLALAVPAVYGVMARLGVVDSILGLILINMGASAYNIWLLKGYIDGIPRELDEAAMVDGATPGQIFWRVILPLSAPMLAVMFLFNFMAPFNEYILTSAIIKNPNLYTLPLGLRTMVQNAYSVKWGEFSAAAILTSVPLAIIWGLGQRWIQANLTRGAIRG